MLTVGLGDVRSCPFPLLPRPGFSEILNRKHPFLPSLRVRSVALLAWSKKAGPAALAPAAPPPEGRTPWLRVKGSVPAGPNKTKDAGLEESEEEGETRGHTVLLALYRDALRRGDEVAPLAARLRSVPVSEVHLLQMADAEHTAFAFLPGEESVAREGQPRGTATVHPWFRFPFHS